MQEQNAKSLYSVAIAAVGLEKLRPHFALIRWMKLAPPMHTTLRDSEKCLPTIG